MPPECALGTRASSCLGSLRAALGTEFPVASKGAGSQLSSQGARTAGKLAWPLPPWTQPRCQTSEASGGFGLRPRMMGPGQHRARRFWEPCWHFLVLSTLPKRPRNHTQNKVSRVPPGRREDEREGEETVTLGKAPPGPGNFSWPSQRCPFCQDVAGTSHSDTHSRRVAGPSRTERGLLSQVCRPGALQGR